MTTSDTTSTPTSSPVPAPPAAPAIRPGDPNSAPNGLVYEWLWGDARSRAAVVFLLIVTLLAVFAPWVTSYDPFTQDVRAVLQGPSRAHWLGTDDLGRDVWARMVFGTRISLQASLIAVSVALALGIPVGLIAGFRGGWIDMVLMRITDTMLSFPSIVLAVGVTAALGPGLVNAMLAVGIVFSPSVARIMRGQVLTTKERTYVDAATTFGSPAFKIVIRHIVPNSIQPVVIQATLMLGLALLAEASLSFLGLGVQHPQPSWGIMLRRAAQFIYQQPNGVYFPGLAIAAAVLSFNAVGDSLRDALDPIASARRQLRRAARKGTRRRRRG